MFKKTLTIPLILVMFTAAAQQPVDTFHLYFDLNVAVLSKNVEKKIDLLVYNDKIINGSSVMIIGYADYLGSEGYNKNLSMQRAKNIRNYLVKYGLNAGDIITCVGKGEVDRKEKVDIEGSPIDRRVDIVVNNTIRTEIVYKTKSNSDTKNKIDTSSSGIAVRKKSADLKELTTLKAGQTLLLKNVYFPPGSHIIKSESYATLEKLFKVLQDNPQLKISIEGHVCCIHDVPDALDIDTNEPILSLNRAKAIFIYLVNKGIDEARLEYKGYGKQRPIIDYEKTEEDADRNRRVEIRVLK